MKSVSRRTVCFKCLGRHDILVFHCQDSLRSSLQDDEEGPAAGDNDAVEGEREASVKP